MVRTINELSGTEANNRIKTGGPISVFGGNPSDLSGQVRSIRFRELLPLKSIQRSERSWFGV